MLEITLKVLLTSFVGFIGSGMFAKASKDNSRKLYNLFAHLALFFFVMILVSGVASIWLAF